MATAGQSNAARSPAAGVVVMHKMKYRDIQPAHENSVLDSFEGYLKESGATFQVIERPDPPDALVNIDGEPCWVEITDAFQSIEWAKSITSYAAEDKTHTPRKSGVIFNPDSAACEKVKEVIVKKYDKQTMKDLYLSRGQGILLVGAYTPLTTLEEIIEQGSDLILSEISQKISIFKSIYLYQNSQQGHVFSKFL